MYDKFHLSAGQKSKINEFLSGEKILLLSGLPGCGKTELARTIFHRISIHINSSSINNSKNIGEGILSSVKKKNIMMMFEEKREYREILIDDFDVLMKHDKKLFSELLQFLQDGKYYHSKIIVIINSPFLKNRKLKKIKYIHLDLSYHLSTYYKIVKSVLDEKQIKKTSCEIDQLVYHSKYNLNILHSLLAYSSDSLDVNNDSFDTIEDIIKNIMQSDYTMESLVRLCETNENIIGLNCLENSLQFVKKDDCLQRLTRIYNYYVFSDIVETTMIKNHRWEFRNYLSILTVYQCYLEREKHNDYKLIYNKYISKALITTSLQKIMLLQNKKESDLIYFYLYLYTKQRITKEELLLKLTTVNKKYYRNIIQLFEYLEDDKLNLKL